MSQQEQTDSLDMSGISKTLPGASPVLTADDRASLIATLKDKLQSLSSNPTDILDALSPKVKKRVEYLVEIQKQHDVLESNFFEERAALEEKYQKLYAPLYAKRYEIVTGAVDVEGGEPNGEIGEANGEVNDAQEKGVPEFWLNALKTHDVTGEAIQERDEEALKYLTDIKWSRTTEPKGFKLDFFFDPNPFFKNPVLSKTYQMIEDDEPVLEKAIGTEIEWYPGKCLTQKVLKKKPKKGSKDTKPVTKTTDCESFFNFFNPPPVPEDVEDLDEEEAEELQNQMEQDYDVGSVIRDKIIPHAVSWYTGEAVSDDDLFDDDDDDDDDEDDDEDMLESSDDGNETDEEDDESEDEAEKKPEPAA